MEHDLSRDEVAFARDGSTERAQHGQSVLVESHIGAPNDRGVGDVLKEERGEVWAVVVEFGLQPELRAVQASLLGVRRADRDIQGGARVAEGGGDDVGGPEIGAKDERPGTSVSAV